MARKRTTGTSEPYSDAEEAAVADALEAALADDLGDLGEQGSDTSGTGPLLDVTAEIEWNGTVDRVRGSDIRQVKFNGLSEQDYTTIKRAAAGLRRARGIGPEGGFRSYRAKGWRAQLRQLQRTRRGRAALDAAGLNPATVRRWQTGRQQPSPASRARLAGAYTEVANPRSSAVQHAQQRLAETLTGILRERHGDIRLRNIQDLRFGNRR